MKKKVVAGIGVGSGKKESFYFCVLEYFEDKQRWFLKTCQQLKDFQYPEVEDSILSWIKDFKIETIVVDFPLTLPPCSTCEIKCPGSYFCKVDSVVQARKKMTALLEKDQKLYDQDPKGYERERAKTDSNLLSKTLKRRLKSGYIPYWNRSVDVDLWIQYHDEMIEYFKTGYQSFGQDNFTQIMRFDYLKRHLPKDIEIYETSTMVVLIELLRAKTLRTKNLYDLANMESSALGRIDILKKLEESYDLFFYENDFETMAKHPKAFQSFILSFAAMVKEKKNIPLTADQFFIPQF